MTVDLVEKWTRQPTDVETIRLNELRDFHAAEVWMRAHGVQSAHRHPALSGRALLVPVGPGGIFTIARFGQRLVRDETTGVFTVIDEHDFRAVHTYRGEDAPATPVASPGSDRLLATLHRLGTQVCDDCQGHVERAEDQAQQ